MPQSPVTIREPRQMPLPMVVLFSAGLLAIVVTLTLMVHSLVVPLPIANAETFPQSVALDFSTMPTAQPFPSAIAVMILPTLTPVPEPTYALLPTVVPSICGMGNAINEECVWPQPTPTREAGPPVCVTPMPKETCVWRGWPRHTSED